MFIFLLAWSYQIYSEIFCEKHKRKQIVLVSIIKLCALRVSSVYSAVRFSPLCVSQLRFARGGAEACVQAGVCIFLL